MHASHTATLWPVFILVCVLSHCGIVAGDKKLDASFVTGVPVRLRSGSVLRSSSDEAAVERLVSGVFQRDSSRCSESSFSLSVNPLPLHSWRQRFSGNDVCFVFSFVCVFDGGGLHISGVD